MTGIDVLRAAGWTIAAERDTLRAINAELIEENAALRLCLIESSSSRPLRHRYSDAVAELTGRAGQDLEDQQTELFLIVSICLDRASFALLHQ